MLDELESKIRPGQELILEAEFPTTNFRALLSALTAGGFVFLRHRGSSAVFRRDKINVLYLAPWVTYGGSDKGTVDWFRHCPNHRFRCFLLTTQPSANELLHLIEPLAEEVWALPDLIPGRDMPRFILDFIATRNIQLVHIMNSKLGFDLLPAIKREHPQVRTVVQLHVEEEDQSGYCRYVCTRYDNLVDRFSVTSAQLERALYEYDVSPSKISVIYTGVDTDGEFANTGSVAPQETGEPLAVLYPARLTDQKDPLLMLEVARRLKSAGSKAVIHSVGDGDLAEVVRSNAKVDGLDDLVLFHGATIDMPPWFAKTDVTLLTSRFEGLPFVVFEAMAMGHPVIAPDVGGTREVIDASTGFLIQHRDDPDAFVSAILSLERHPDLRARMGSAARKKVTQHFSVKRMAAEHAALYRDLITCNLEIEFGVRRAV